MKNIIDKYQGAFIGLAIGDTLGMSVEFEDPKDFEPLTEPIAGGTFDLPLGYWTDDTSMALCLADSLLEKGGYDSFDVMDKYWVWWSDGYRSSTGACFDIGNQTVACLEEYKSGGKAVIPKNKDRTFDAGNGSVMRLAPLIIASHSAGNSLEETMELSRISGRETHYSFMAEASTALFGAMIFNAFEAKEKEEIFDLGLYKITDDLGELINALKTAKEQDPSNLKTGGYVLDSLVCAVWSFLNNVTFESGALAVVNLGGDSDTNGAIYGQLAGAYYGIDSIPEEWKKILHLESEISDLAIRLGNMKSCKVIQTRFEEDEQG